MNHSRVATLSAALACAAVAMFAAGPALARLDSVSAFVAFRIFGLGLLLGVCALVAGAAGLWQTRPKAERAGRGRAIAGVLIASILLAITATLASTGASVPVINDITTDTSDPPRFIAAATDDANSGRDLGYPGEEFATQQRSGYPDLAPIRVSAPPAEAFDRCVAAAEALGWKLTTRDAAAGRFEAIATTRVFGFIDDIVVRVRRDGSDSVVDVRSKSRDGRGDMGANAARIRAFRSVVDS